MDKWIVESKIDKYKYMGSLFPLITFQYYYQILKILSTI